MAIGIGVDRLSALMNDQYASYQGSQTGLSLLSQTELETFDVAIPKMLNRHYTNRVSGVIYSTYAGSYLVGLMRAKKLLGDLMYNGNDGEAGILSKELCFNMFKDDSASPSQKSGWGLTETAAANTWEPMIGYSTSSPSTITNDEFGSMVISHVTNLADRANITKMQYHINGNPRTVQYVEPAFKLNENGTYMLDVPLIIVKNTKLFVEGLTEIAGLPVKIMQGGVAFATANWFNSQTPSL
ncbi:hypothetical protein DRN77_06545 [Methanosarcinales archaeon]|nr:MAG: hypothetical protein DRN77_06545 [Methanosarcinales archaeon]